MIIMILGELCNFAAYAFVEAIIVVCALFTYTKVLTRRTCLSSPDAVGRSLCRHILAFIALPPRRKAVLVRLDLLRSMSHRLVHPRAQWPRRTKCYDHHRL